MFYYVVTMYFQNNVKKVGSKVYHSTLLVESHREDGKVKHRTLANVTNWPSQIVDGLRLLIKGKRLGSIPACLGGEDISWKTGKSFGGLFVLRELAKDLFIKKILGSSRLGKLALLLVLGRILTQGSRRHLTFWKEGQAIIEVLGIKTLDEDDLYRTLDWLEENQSKMEREWFRLRFRDQRVEFFLYDVTSSYLEGEKNELARYGYNRDGKKGKKQIVIGLLATKEGLPIAVEVFEGNISDVSTIPNQIKKMAERFNVSDVIFVGDRGMVKKIPIEKLTEQKWHYITAITKSQIESLIKEGIFQMELFEDKLVEITHEGVRYCLRRNPARQKEMRQNRAERLLKAANYCEELNERLKTKPKAKIAVAKRNLENKIKKLKLNKVISVEEADRRLKIKQDDSSLCEMEKLDGCYVIKTDVSKERISTEEVHTTYKRLSEIEWAFRTMKTGLLEIRPLYHRKATRTRGCAFVAMLAYAVIHELWQRTKHLDIPLSDIIASLDQIQTKEICIENQWVSVTPTEVRDDQKIILSALKIILPKKINSVPPKK